EWYFVIFALAGSSLLGLWWHPLRLVLPLLLLALTVTLVQACRCGAGASFQPTPPTRTELWLRRMLTGLLYLLQPLARLVVRVRCWPVWARSAVGLALFLAVLSVMAARDGAWAASVPLAVAAGAIVERMFRELAATTAAFLTVVREIERAEKIPAKDVMNA